MDAEGSQGDRTCIEARDVATQTRAPCCRHDGPNHDLSEHMNRMWLQERHHYRLTEFVPSGD